jgi:protein-L-isoaspartate(D-aspartate) O-methyltransferase
MTPLRTRKSRTHDHKPSSCLLGWSQMEPAEELAIIRRAYAKQVLAAAQVDNSHLEQAFAQVRREDFLGPGPWVIPRWISMPFPTPSADPVYLYIDNVVQIIAERQLNNGQPSGHARWIASASIKPGEHVVHIGTGTGYYTAILSHLAGPSGKVTGIELDTGLAARAKENLSSYTNVNVVEGDGTTAPFDGADVIYVNAGVTRPADQWIDRLREGGRLILPLTTNGGFKVPSHGAVFRIERRASEFLAQWISPVAIIPCEGARDETSDAALAEAFKKRGRWLLVTRLYRRDDLAEDRCWLRASGWCLAYE